MSDTKLFRKSLAEAGFFHTRRWAPTVFNDKHKGTPTRRLKLWFGDEVFDASQKTQKTLERALKKNFGERYLYGKFAAKGGYHGGGKAFCVYLLTA